MAAILEPPHVQKQTKLVTADDLLKLPRDFRCQLVRGEIIELPPPPGGEHGSKIERITIRVGFYILSNDLGECFAAETGFKIHSDPDTVRAPDWAFVRKERLSGRITKKHLPLAPDIVLEVKSPGDSLREFADTVLIWLLAGAQAVWAVDPTARTLTVHRPGSVVTLGPTDTLTCEDLLPGFSLPLSLVFESE